MEWLAAYLATQGAARVRRWLLPVLVMLVVGIVALSSMATAVVLGPPPSVFAPPAPAAAACTPTTPSASATTSVAAGALPPEQVAQAAYAAGWRGADVVTAVAVAYAESGLDPQAFNPAAGGNKGLWQINNVHAALLAQGDWRVPADNAVMAFAIWNEAGGSWTPWEAYTNHAYAKFLPQAQAAVASTAGTLPQVALPADCLAPGAGSVAPDGSLVDPGPGPMNAEHLRPRTANGKAIALANWGCASGHPAPCVKTVGGYAVRTIAGTNKLSKHADGLANDIMLPDFESPASRALGNEIAAYYVANAPNLGVDNVIYYDRIWNAAKGWHDYHPKIVNATTRHHDHVHVDYLG